MWYALQVLYIAPSPLSFLTNDLVFTNFNHIESYVDEIKNDG
jgi:hypothetical protein